MRGAARRHSGCSLRSRSSARARPMTATRSRRSRGRRCPGRPRTSRWSRPTSADRAAQAIRRRPCAPTAPGPPARTGRPPASRATRHGARPGASSARSSASRFPASRAPGATTSCSPRVRSASPTCGRPRCQLLGDPRGATVAAAKRVFAFGDPIVLERRAAELAGAALLPPGALDLGLSNWALRTGPRGAPRPAALGSRPRPTPMSATSCSRRSEPTRPRTTRTTRRRTEPRRLSIGHASFRRGVHTARRRQLAVRRARSVESRGEEFAEARL